MTEFSGGEPVALAMFPLQSALLPNEDLPLRIFEPRYSALVRDCIAAPNPLRRRADLAGPRSRWR